MKYRSEANSCFCPAQKQMGSLHVAVLWMDGTQAPNSEFDLPWLPGDLLCLLSYCNSNDPKCSDVFAYWVVCVIPGAVEVNCRHSWSNLHGTCHQKPRRKDLVKPTAIWQVFASIPHDHLWLKWQEHPLWDCRSLIPAVMSLDTDSPAPGVVSISVLKKRSILQTTLSREWTAFRCISVDHKRTEYELLKLGDSHIAPLSHYTWRSSPWKEMGTIWSWAAQPFWWAAKLPCSAVLPHVWSGPQKQNLEGNGTASLKHLLDVPKPVLLQTTPQHHLLTGSAWIAQEVNDCRDRKKGLWLLLSISLVCVAFF